MHLTPETYYRNNPSDVKAWTKLARDKGTAVELLISFVDVGLGTEELRGHG